MGGPGARIAAGPGDVDELEEVCERAGGLHLTHIAPAELVNADAAKGRSRTRSSVTTAKCPGAGRVIILTAEGRSAARQP